MLPYPALSVNSRGVWVPAFAGMTWEGAGMTWEGAGYDVGGCGSVGVCGAARQIPAFAGMTKGELE